MKHIFLQTLTLLPLLLGINFRPASVKASDSAFFVSEEKNVSMCNEAAPLHQGDDNRYVAYGYIEEFYPMSVIRDDSVHQYAGDDLDLVYDLTYIYDRNQFCADKTNVYLIWQAPYSGKVTFHGKLSNCYSYAQHGENIRDGVKISFYNRKTKESEPILLDQVNPTSDFIYYLNDSKTFNVTLGECFFFEFDSNESVAWDNVLFTFGAAFLKTGNEKEAANIDSIGFEERINWKQYYGTTQGINNTYYLYGNPSHYALMNYCKTQYYDFMHWHGVEGDQYIHDGYLNPGNLSGTMLAWIAESSGTISIKGFINPIHRKDSGTDGFIAKVFLNENELFTLNTFKGNYKKYAVLPKNLSNLKVNQGDKVFFQVTAGDYYNSGWDGVGFRCEIKYIEKDKNVLTSDEKLASFTESTYQEILNVNHVDIVIPHSFNETLDQEKGCTGFLGLSSLRICVLFSVLGAALVYKKSGAKKDE